MGEIADIDTYGTDETVCPFCGYVGGDSWELSGDDGTATCGKCHRDYEWVRDMSVTYSTRKPKDAPAIPTEDENNGR